MMDAVKMVCHNNRCPHVKGIFSGNMVTYNSVIIDMASMITYFYCIMSCDQSVSIRLITVVACFGKKSLKVYNNKVSK